MPPSPAVTKGLQKAGIPTAQRHAFVCLGPNCCDAEANEPLWQHIKSRIKEAGIPVMRTKANCLRICTGGPWLVVYPEGIWYGQLTPERFDRILEQHLTAGQPVTEWISARNGESL